MVFNLLDDPWVPIVRGDGSAADCGLRELFGEAPRIAELNPGSPLESAAVLRLVLAIVYRVFGNPSESWWQETWERGSFDLKVLEDYLECWGGRFNLFDEEKPFFQQGALKLKNSKPLSFFNFADSGTNNTSHFSHSIVQEPPRAFDPATAARLLLTYIYFSPNAGRSETGYTENTPLADIYVYHARGEDLFQTIMLNLAHIPSSRVPHTTDDRPCWERDAWEPTKDRYAPKGISDYLTWPTRVVKLLPEHIGEGIVCRYCYRGHGISLVDELYEPFTGYSKKTKGGEVTTYKWKFDKDRAVWRDSAALFASIHLDDYLPPVQLDWLARFVSQGFLQENRLYDLEISGYAKKTASQPTIYYWRRERLPLPLAYLDDEHGPSLVNALSQALQLAEDVGRALDYALLVMGRFLIRCTLENPNQKLGKEAEGEAKHLRDSFGAGPRYWVSLETPFRRMLVDIPDDADGAIERWALILRKESEQAFNLAAAAAGTSARALKASTKARGVFKAKLYSKENGIFRDTHINEKEDNHA